MATANPFREHFELFARTGGCLGGFEIIVVLGGKILVVPVLEDRLEDVFERRIRHGSVNS
jgi:hypothetical protein